MKVEKADYVWAVLSFITVGVSFHFGYLLYGLLAIYGFMVLLFLYHVFKVKKQISGTEAAFGKITEYRTKKGSRTYYYPVVEFETADGRSVSSVYTYPDKEQKYEIGDEELIRYDPDDPIFFYFANRENELTDNYYRYILFGGIPALIVLILIFALR
ncbi:MAG: DUF3592 domain-containing protein [Ruminococcus sp.]|nr:DUF3592 domain-containing protein [Ruminococcus sp.]